MASVEAPKLGMLKGFYNKNCSTQGVSVEKCKSLLAQAAEQVPCKSSTTVLHIAEWGCASGGNSIAPVLTISEILNQRVFSNGGHKLQLHVTHTDVSGNSWTELFQCAKQYQKQAHRDFPHLSVTYAGIGSSQYEPNHPSGSLDLGFSFNALHWLSKWPCHLKHTLSPFSSKALPEELCALDAQASEDLLTFLTLRADEFKPGGYLVLNFGAIDHTNRQFFKLMEGPQAVAEEMVAEGLLAEGELGHLAPPVYFLDEAGHKKVFSQVSDRWELLHYDIALASNPQVEELMKEGASSNAAACGQIVANFLKAAMCPFLEAGLRKFGRDQATVDALVDSFYSRVAERVAANPVNATYPTARVLLRRRV